MVATEPRELMHLVERVVRPLPLPLERQMRLRADYLEHLQAIYAEELLHSGEPVEALHCVKQRFGDPAQITAELRKSIRWQEILRARIQASVSQRADESLARYAARLTTQFVLITLLLLGLILADHHIFGDGVSSGDVQWALGSVVFVAIWLWCLLVFGMYVGAAWERQPRSWISIVALSLIHFASWPLSLVILMKLADGSWVDYSMPLVMSVAGGLFSVICGSVAGAKHIRETLYVREWAGLQIDVAHLPESLQT